MPTLRRPLLAMATAALMLPLAACYNDGYDGGPQGYGPPPPPPPGQGGYYQDGPPPQGPGDNHGQYQGDRPPPPPPGYDQGSYQGNRPPPPLPPSGYQQGGPNGYDPGRDYRDEPGHERAMSRDDNVYQGHDGRYYCKRSDGTTGLVVGAVAGGALGAILGHGGALGTLLGAGGGALLGKSVDQGQVHCR